MDFREFGNSTVLRFFTINSLDNYLAIRPIIADIAILIIIGSFGYRVKPKNRARYFYGWTIFLSVISTIIAYF